MTTFTIDQDNNITAFAATEQVPEGQDSFTTQEEFAKISAEWPITRFPEIWNAFAGAPPFGELKPVKKFMDRKTAVARIWKAIQTLEEGVLRPPSIRDTEATFEAPQTVLAQEASVAQQTAPVAPKEDKAAKDATAKDAAPTAREGSKKSIVLDLLQRPEGATLQDIVAATGWQAHSVRGFISGSLGKKMGLTVESFKTPDGARTYHIVAK